MDTKCKIFLHDNSMVEMIIELKSIVGSHALHALPIHRRKCRFVNESSLHYYPYYYTENLCQITCRIQSALKLCNCVPFFYYSGKCLLCNALVQMISNAYFAIFRLHGNGNADEKSCTPAELYCLSKTDWYKPDCQCLPLCKYEMYVKSSTNYYVCLSVY